MTKRCRCEVRGILRQSMQMVTSVLGQSLSVCIDRLPGVVCADGGDKCPGTVYAGGGDKCPGTVLVCV